MKTLSSSVSVGSVVLAALLVSGCATGWQYQRDLSRFDEALAAQREGDLDGALALYASLQPRERRYPGVLNNIGVIHAQRGELEQAQTMLETAVALDPDLVAAWANLGVVRFHQGEHAAAFEALRQVTPARQRAIASLSTTGRANWYRAEEERANGRFTRIADHYLEQLAQPPSAIAMSKGAHRAAIRLHLTATL